MNTKEKHPDEDFERSWVWGLFFKLPMWVGKQLRFILALSILAPLLCFVDGLLGIGIVQGGIDKYRKDRDEGKP